MPSMLTLLQHWQWENYNSNDFFLVNKNNWIVKKFHDCISIKTTVNNKKC